MAALVPRSSLVLTLIIILMSVFVHALIASFPSAALPRLPTVAELNEKASLEGVSTVHLVVLVHGWMGNPSELSYLHQSLQQQASAMVWSNRTRVVVHAAECNDGNTSDGISAGGERLAKEINQLVEQLSDGNRQVSFSIIGNSLGGLYARYALSCISLENLTPEVFCTTATPHLGVSQQTYVPLPRPAEYTVGYASRDDSLKDMFRITSNVMDRMAFDLAFTRPLKAFQHRIAYANAYYTDFQVPTATAAFLSATDSPHLASRRAESADPEFVELRVTTPIRELESRVPADTISLEQVATQLDALGWTKVFCDLRSSLPTIMNWPWQPSSPLLEQKTYTSLQLLRTYASFDWRRWHAPLGHTVLVANSKNALYRRVNAGGMVVMDYLAEQVLTEILDEDGRGARGV